MKRNVSILLVLSVVFCLGGCAGGVSTEEHQALQIEYTQLKEDYNALKSEYDAFKAEASGFLALTEEQQAEELAKAESARLAAEEEARQAAEEAKRREEERKAEEERQEAERKAEEERQRQEEEARLQEEESLGYETGITLQELSRSPDDYIGKKVKFSGRIAQVIEGTDTNELLMTINGRLDGLLYGIYPSDLLRIRLLADDEVTIYGVANGLETYTTVLGDSRTLPLINIDKIELNWP